MVVKKPVSVKAVLADIREGRSKDEIMSRHGLSKRGLKSLFMKMTTAGYLKKSDMEQLRRNSTKGKKRKVSAREVLADLKAGLTDAGLMKKYRLSVKGLDALFARLLRERLVTEGDLFTRGSQLHGTVDILPSDRTLKALTNEGLNRLKRSSFSFHCPQCRSRQVDDHDVCPRCGFNVAEFNEQHAEGRKKASEAEEEKPHELKAPEPDPPIEGTPEVVPKQGGSMALLRRALEAGVLTPAEFTRKKEELLLRDGNGEALPVLEDLLKAGLVTDEEFEIKRRELTERSTKFAQLREAFELGGLSDTQFARSRSALIGGSSSPPRAEELPQFATLRAGTHGEQSTEGTAIDLALKPGEQLLNSSEVIFSPWFLTVFGRMTVTDRRLLFKPHGWAIWLAAIQSAGIAWLARKVRNEPLEVSISRVQSVSSKTFLGIFKGLTVRMRSGVEHRFLFSRKTAQGGGELLAAIATLLRKRSLN